MMADSTTASSTMTSSTMANSMTANSTMAASPSKGLNFTVPLLSGGELKHEDLRIDAKRVMDALQVRSNILDTNHSLARMMGESLKANQVAEDMRRDVFEGLDPRLLDFDGNHLDTVIRWADLVQEVPATQFHPVPNLGDDDHSDQALMYQCWLEMGVVQITAKQLNLFRFVQNNCSQSSNFEEDVKKEAETVAAEAIRCDELIETVTKLTEPAIELRDKLRNRARSCQVLLGVVEEQTQDTNTVSANHNVNASSIPISRKTRFIPFSEEEQRDTDSYVANARRSGLSWVQISKEYAQVFGVQRHSQFFRRRYSQYACGEVNPGPA